MAIPIMACVDSENYAAIPVIITVAASGILAWVIDVTMQNIEHTWRVDLGRL